MNFVWYVVWFLVAVSLLVAVHEYGHYFAARKLGFKVLRFSVGFGRPLWRRVAGPDQTEYVLAALPLGGYVKLLDEREGPVAPEDLARSFTRKHPWKRIVVLLAGPAANIIFAIVVLWGIFWFAGSPDVRAVIGTVVPDSIAARSGLRDGDEVTAFNGRPVAGRSDVILGLVDSMSGDGVADMIVRDSGGSTRTVALRVEDAEVRRALTEPGAFSRGLGFQFWAPPRPAVIGKVLPGGPAERAGLRTGDRVLSVDGIAISGFESLVQVISDRPGQEVTIAYQRGSQRSSVRVMTLAEANGDRQIGRIRVETTAPAPLPDSMIVTRSYGPLGALAAASRQAWDMTVLQAKMFWRMIAGDVSLKNLSGPLSIAEYAGESASGGVKSFLGFLVLISLSLGFLNLLPVPILDGGQIVFQLAEWLKGSPLSDRTQAFGQQVGIALLLLLMGVALFNDVARQFG